MANKNYDIAKDVLEQVGGKENVTLVLHCMTRLRFNLKDESIPCLDQIKNINGIIGAQWVSGQLQVIIGQNVNKVYDEVCKIGGFTVQEGLDEEMDKVKEKLTLKKIGGLILEYISGAFNPVIPIILACSLFKAICSIIGPDLLNIASPENHFYILCDFVYDAGFYFLPIFLGYTAAKKLNTSIPIGMALGAILLAPDFIAMQGQSFTVFGIPAPINNYSNSLLPILIAVWIMSYVYKYIKKYMPTVLSTVFTPFCTIFIMLPIMFCVVAPIGSYGADLIVIFLNWCGGFAGGLIALALIGGLWEYVIMTGMHVAPTILAISLLTTQGSDNLILVGCNIANFSAFGMALGALIYCKKKENKSLCLGYVITGLLSGIVEVSLYGVGFKYKKPFIAMSIGGLVGGVFAAITNVTMYTLSPSMLPYIAYVGGTTSNLFFGNLSLIISFVVAAIGTYMIAFKENEV